jgi:hypothetical protein
MASPPTLRRSRPRAYLHSRRRPPMSAGSPRDPAELRRHCVTRPRREFSRRFLNENRNFDADCVTRCPQVKSGQRRASVRRGRARTRCLAPQPATKPILFIVVRVSLAPRRCRTPNTLALTRRIAAHVLPIARARVRLVPPTADPARALAGHRPRASCTWLPARAMSLDRSSATPWVRFREHTRARPVNSSRARWVRSHEHTRVHSRER